MKLTGFEGQVVVRGTVCNACFSGNALTITGMNMAEAHDVLAVLESESELMLSTTSEVMTAEQAQSMHDLVHGKEVVEAATPATKQAESPVGESSAATAKPETKPKRQRKSKKKKTVADTVGKVDDAPAATSEASSTPPTPSTDPTQDTQESSVEAASLAEVADDFAEAVADKVGGEVVCEACSGTGKNSRGGVCRSCAVPVEDDFADPTTTSQRSGGNGARKTPGVQVVTEVPKQAGSAVAPHTSGPPEVPTGTDLLGGEGSLPEEVVTAVRVRQVLNYLMDKGFKDEAAIVAWCADNKDDVPVLSRIANLDERIKRTLSVMQIE